MSTCEHALQDLLNRAENRCLWIVDDNLSLPLLSSISPRDGLHTLTNRAHIAKALSLRGISHQLNDFDFSSVASSDTVVYRVSKERALVQHCIWEAFNSLRDDGTLYLLGEKKEGIKTHGKYAQSVFQQAPTIEKLGHCYRVCVQKIKDTVEQAPTRPQYHSLEWVQTDDLSFYSKRGVYGWKKIDAGSRLLMQSIEPMFSPKQARTLSLLDLGCGYGYLTLMAARLGFQAFVATDNNAASILAASKNFSHYQLTVDLSLDDCGEGINRQFDIVLCNPPFHRGFAHDKTLIRRFVQRGMELLSHQGSAFFVVNEFVPLAQVGKDLGCRVDCLSHAHGFKVFQLRG